MNSKLQWATKQEQQDFQAKKLKELLDYLSKKSSYYKRIFAAQNVDIDKIKSLSDLQFLPTTSKENLQENNWDFLCVPKSEVIEYMSTSGTLGKPVTIALTKNDLIRLAYNEQLTFQLMDICAEDTVQLMLTLDRQFMAGIAYYSGLQQIGATAIRTGPGLPEMQIETIQRLESNALVAVPSFLLKLIQHSKEQNIDINTLPIKKVLAIGESIRDENLENNVLSRNILQHWNVELFGTYAATEMQSAFSECTAHKGGHHQPELIILELLDENGKPVLENEAGEVTITTLGVEGMPLLRYRTGDICKTFHEPCGCGRTTMRLGPVLGRKKQMIKYKGTTLFPSAIFEKLNSVNAVSEYVVEVTKDHYGQDDVTLHIYTKRSTAECDTQLKSAMKAALRVIPKIVYHTAEALHAMQFPPTSRKQIKFIDTRP